MRVSVLVLDGVFDSGLAVVLDTLETASELAQLAPAGQGPRPDLVIVPALGAKTVETISLALERRDIQDSAPLLRSWVRSGARVAGACTATFVLASSGILDGGRATTTWWLSPLFRARYPGVALDESRMVVESGKVVTAGAALAHVDLALWLVRQRSPSLADATAKYLVFDARPSQGSFVMTDHLAHADPLVERFEHWARRHLTDFRLAEAARGVGASERTLERRIRMVLGKTPLSFVQDLRVEMAVHRLRTTRDSIEEIATAVGYGDGVTLRTLLRRKTGRGIRELRAAAV
jgi:transcriptional regulator GlxA family with amidase domain